MMFKSKEQKFWQWFSKVESEVHANFNDEAQREGFFEELSKEIKKINENLAFEFGGNPNNETIEFAISADGIKSAFSDVIKLYKASPPLKPRWEIVAFRQRHEDAEGYKMKFDEYEMGCDDIYFLYAIDDEDSEELFRLQLHVRNYHEDKVWAVYILLDSLLGEYDATMSIDSIDWVKLDDNNIENLSRLVELRRMIDERNTRRNTLN